MMMMIIGMMKECDYFSSVSQQYKPLGMKNGRIPSSAISASSKWDRYHGPNRGRLQITRRGRYIGAWSAKHNNPYQWIRVDFRKPVKILAVATQGRQDLSQWVTRYYLTYSFDGINFVPYLCRKVNYWNFLSLTDGGSQQNSSWSSFLIHPHLNISLHFLHTVLHTFLKVLTRRICLTIKSFFSCWSFPLFSQPSCLILGWYCEEKLDASHS